MLFSIKMGFHFKKEITVNSDEARKASIQQLHNMVSEAITNAIKKAETVAFIRTTSRIVEVETGLKKEGYEPYFNEKLNQLEVRW